MHNVVFIACVWEVYYYNLEVAVALANVYAGYTLIDWFKSLEFPIWLH